MPQFRFLFSILLATLFCASSAYAQEKIDLRVRANVGDRHSITVAIDDSHTEVYVEDKTQTRLQIRAVVETESIEPRKDGAMRLKITYRQLTVTDTQNGVITRYDSQRDAKNSSPMATIFNAMIGQSLTAVMNAKGKVLAIEGVEEFKNRLIESMKLPPSEQAKVRQMLKDNFSAETMADAAGAVVLPEKPVAVGESWQRQFIRREELYSLQVAQTSTLKSVVNSVATVETLEKISADPKTKTTRNGVDEFKYLMNGYSKTSIGLDEISGQSISMKTEQRLSGHLVIVVKDSKSANADSEPVRFRVYAKHTLQAWGKKLTNDQN